MNSAHKTLSANNSRLILHIGQQKTGTTSFQMRMHEARVELLEQSIYYPTANHGLAGHHILRSLSLETQKLPPFMLKAYDNDQKIVQAELRNMLSAIESTCAKHPTATTILSSELFSTIPDEADILSFLDTLKKFHSTIQAVAYVRSPIEGMMSRLQQSLYLHTLMRRATWQLQAQKMLLWKKATKSNLELRPFVKSKLVGNDIVEDFFSSYLPGKIFPKARKDARPENFSMSAEGMYIVQKCKLFLEPSGASIHNSLTWRLIRRVRRIDFGLEGYASAKLKAELLIPLMRKQVDANILRQEFGLEFEDLDYTEIGKPSDLDLEALRMVENICEIDNERMVALSKKVIEKFEADQELSTLITKALAL